MPQVTMTPEELRKMQLIQIELLREFDRVCRKHGIRYIIASGTLLGAVRYGGFIPWDDDIDIEMLRSDYEKFSRAANEMNERIFFQTHKSDKAYPWLYGKLRMNGTAAVRVGQEHMKMHSGVFVDVFPRDPMPGSECGRQMFEFIAKTVRKILYSRVMCAAAATVPERVAWHAARLIPKRIPFAIAWVMRKLFNEERSRFVRCMGYHGRYETEGYDRRWFTELTEVEFEGGMYYAPADRHGYLKFVYGSDYMTPPPENARTISSPLSSYCLGDTNESHFTCRRPRNENIEND
jgi:lipopolysaccharide cholinephosphotransferase